MAFFITLLLALMQASPYVPPRLQRSAPVSHPPNIIANSWVVLDIQVDRQGAPQSIQKILGEEPFLGIATTSVRQWAFSPARNPSPTESHVTAVFLFRAREVFAGSPFKVSASGNNGGEYPPLPQQLVDTGYPVNSIAEGATVIELQTSDKGETEDARILSDTAGFAGLTDRTARLWKFQPAVREGRPAPGTVIGVISYLRPVTVPSAPSATGRGGPGSRF